MEEVHAPILPTAWTRRRFSARGRFDPLQVVPTVIVAVLYFRRTQTLAARGPAVSRWKQASFWTGIALVVFALDSPVDALGEEHFFFIHMLQHVVLGDLAPLCFMAGLSGPILQPVLKLPGVERLRILAHPLVALPVWALNLYIWHIPFLYDGALHHDAVHALEHFMFFTCGCLIWEPVVETLPAPAWFGTGVKIGYIFVVRLIETVLGNVFIWTNAMFYTVYRTRPSGGSRRRTT